jgi:hypothetical protein
MRTFIPTEKTWGNHTTTPTALSAAVNFLSCGRDDQCRKATLAWLRGPARNQYLVGSPILASFGVPAVVSFSAANVTLTGGLALRFEIRFAASYGRFPLYASADPSHRQRSEFTSVTSSKFGAPGEKKLLVGREWAFGAAYLCAT